MRSLPSLIAAILVLSPGICSWVATAPPAVRRGQWVWCDADRRSFAAAAARLTSLVPAIWVGTIGVGDGDVTLTLAHPPTYVESPNGVALVVRFDDSFHRVWGLPDRAAVVAQVAAKLKWLLAESEGMGVHPVEVQLDYDCPERRLQSWSEVVRGLVGDALIGREVWLTSVPAHLRVDDYAHWFRPLVAGHILQLFDNGPEFGPERAAQVVGLLARQHMPFRLGLGAFERAKPSRVPSAGVATNLTDHGGWFERLPEFSRDALFRGAWVFPAGMRWRPELLGPVR
jgi:hypothetical protein